MSVIQDLYNQAQLSMAAYGTFQIGVINPDELIKNSVGMTLTQATSFAENWRVIHQYDGMVEESYIDEFGEEHFFLNPTGLSATVFENSADGKRHLAIRGTESSSPEWIADWATNIIDIGLLGTAEHQAQYDALSKQVRTWLDDGILQAGFSVAGHSLGGFLGTSLALEYAEVAETYLFNAPGVEGLLGGLLEQIADALMPGKPFTLPPAESLHNIVATWDPVSEVGVSVAPPITIQIESNINPIHNHSIVTLTDSLAIYNLFAAIDENVSVETVTGILQNMPVTDTAAIQEATLAAVGAIYGKTGYLAVETDRDTLYQNLYDLHGSLTQGTVDSLTDVTTETMKSMAQSDQAYLHALLKLNPFAITGVDYSPLNQDGRLDAVNYTDQYLEDRAKFLYFRFHEGEYNWDSTEGIDFYDFSIPGVVAEAQGGLPGIDANYWWGSENDDLLHGALGDNADHLYGMGGDDRLEGYGGDDYMEGGSGTDEMFGGDDSDTFYLGGINADHDYVSGGDGDDKVIGSAQNDVMRFQLFGTEAGEAVEGTPVPDIDWTVELIDGMGGDHNIIAGTSMADHFDFSKTKLEQIHAIDMGRQDDVLVLTNTADLGDVQTINGGDGMDIIQGTTGDDTIDLSAITVTGIERIEGGDGNDHLTIDVTKAAESFSLAA